MAEYFYKFVGWLRKIHHHSQLQWNLMVFTIMLWSKLALVFNLAWWFVVQLLVICDSQICCLLWKVWVKLFISKSIIVNRTIWGSNASTPFSNCATNNTLIFWIQCLFLKGCMPMYFSYLCISVAWVCFMKP